MTTIAKIQPGAMALPVAPAEPSADLSALIAAVQRGVPMTARDLTPALVSEARAIAEEQNTNVPAQEIIIAAWVKKLIPLTVNPPTDPADSAAKISAICEICGDMPVAVWTPETRKAWITQGPQGKFWPAAAELYAHLQPYADKVRRNIEGCRRIVRLAERAGKREEGVSAEERASVARQMAEWRKSMGHADAETERRNRACQIALRNAAGSWRQTRRSPRG